MEYQAVKGMRDLYPEEMRVITWMMDAWRRVSVRNGFEEYEAPIFEYLDLFTAKSGDEIVSQLFSLEDRGGRKLAVRPEITPTLARMINAKINSLPRPIKWFSMPRVCRAENPQKGRLREFFQWNVDVIGSDDILADAECIFVAVDFLREVGLSPTDVQVRIGSRPLAAAALVKAGVTPEQQPAVLAVLDKRPKISPAEFDALAAKAGLSPQQAAAICKFQDAASPADVLALLGDSVAEPVAKLQDLLARLATLGVADYCTLDLRVVRGLAYYTGIVYEVFDVGAGLRALAGGGRYDNLLEVLGGPKVGACGFGMGDVVLGILLQERGKLPKELAAGSVEYYVIDGAEGLADKVLEVVGALRRKGITADFSYKRQNVGKQLKAANGRNAKKSLILQGDDKVAIKNLVTGEQTETTLSQLLDT